VQFKHPDGLEKAMAMKGMTIQGRTVKLDVAVVKGMAAGARTRKKNVHEKFFDPFPKFASGVYRRSFFLHFSEIQRYCFFFCPGKLSELADTDERQSKILQFLAQTGTTSNSVAYRLMEVNIFFFSIS
jgi:hypothetical protein